MNAKQHYREAERLLEDSVILDGMGVANHAADFPGEPVTLGPGAHEGNGNLAAAQVHATLALAAAVMERPLEP